MAVAGPFLLAPLDRLLHLVAVANQREIEDRRGAPEECGLADPRRPVGHMMLGRAGRDDRPAAMDMRVDAARNHNLPRRIDDPAGADRREAAGRADRRDLALCDPDVGRLRPRGQDGGSGGDDNLQHLNLLVL
jgi:hypothetical protein